jgi:hypothetical protein
VGRIWNTLQGAHDRWEKRPKKAWHWWRPDPHSWHPVRHHGPRTVDHEGVEIMRRLRNGAWEYRLPTEEEQEEINEFYVHR